MSAPKNKRNTLAEDLNGLGSERKCTAFVGSSPSGQEKDLKTKSGPSELPPRIGKLISAAVRVWELKRGNRVTWRGARAYQS
jgi:hypothetical protein